MSRVLPAPPSDVVDRLEHILLGRLWIVGRPDLSELDRGDQGPRPRAKVLGCELGTHNLFHVSIKVPGFYVSNLARGVVVLEYLVSWQLHALLDHPSQPAVGYDLALLLPPFSRVLENERIPFDTQVLAPEGGYPVSLVLPRVAVVAHAEEGRVHQARHGREDLLPIQVLVAQVVASDAAHLGHGVGEAQYTLELLALLALAVLGVVRVLEPARRVVPDSLHLGRGAPGDARILPGRRDLQVLDAR